MQVHHVGTEGGRHYFAMDLVEGETLARLVARKGPLAEKVGLEIARKVCLALEHSHGQSLVHRDVKPSNVLIDAKGEPHVADFGLVKDTSERALESRIGMAVGTPAYMAPEQASGQARIDARSDVFSVGALLYDILTGRRPFEGSTIHEVMQQVLNDTPVPPRKHAPALSSRAEKIILRALEKDPARRFASAQAMADEIARALAKGAAETPVPASPLSSTVLSEAQDEGDRGRRRKRDEEYTPIRSLRYNELALSAWKWGVFGFVLAPFGVLLGIGALIQLRFGNERDRETGTGLALGAIGIGSAVTAALVAAGLGIAHVAGSGEREAKAKQAVKDARVLLTRVAAAMERCREKSAEYPRVKDTAELKKRFRDAGLARGEATFPLDREGRIVDPWERPVMLRSPGEANRASYDLWSLGANGKDEQGAGDDIANFDARYADLLPAGEREDEQEAARLYAEAMALPEADRIGPLRAIVQSPLSGTLGGRRAAALVLAWDLAHVPPPQLVGPTVYELDAELQPLTLTESWGACIARCEKFLEAGKDKLPEGDRAAAEQRLASFRGLLAEVWLQARYRASEALGVARAKAFAPGVKPEEIDAALADAARPLEAAARAHDPELAEELARARKGLAPELEEVRRLARAGAFRAAVRERVLPLALRRDYDGALAAAEGLRGAFPSLDGEVDLERRDLERARSLFETALAGARTRAGQDESLKLRGGGWSAGKLEAGAAAGRIALRTPDDRRVEFAAAELSAETLVRLAELVPAEAGKAGERALANGLFCLFDGDVGRAHGWLAKAGALGESVGRAKSKLE